MVSGYTPPREAHGDPKGLWSAEKIVSAIAATYAQTWAKIRIPDGDTESFQILGRVLQGDTLAPFLFIVALDYALRCAIQCREEENGFTLVKRSEEYLLRP